MNKFCNKDITLEAWYAICKSKQVAAGTIMKFGLGQNNITLRRFRNGSIVATQSHCPHMGTDLTLSKEVEGQTFRCAFHGLEFSTYGRCISRGMENKSSYHLVTYPTQEKYGLIWVYIGEEPKYQIPELNLNGGFFLNLPPKKIAAHHHIVICNPLDNVHVGLVHSLYASSAVFKREGVSISQKIVGRYRSRWMKLLLRQSGDMKITFSSVGSSISVADAMWHSTRVVILFTARQDENNKCHTNTVIWMNSYNPIDWLRSLTVIFGILKQDVDILNTIKVDTNFTDLDEGMRLFTDVVNVMPVHNFKA